MVLVYDGSPSGFLCLLGVAVKERLAVEATRRVGEAHSGSLFCAEREVATDAERAAEVAAGLEGRLGQAFLTQLGGALLSEEEGIELDLLQLTRRALREGPGLLRKLHDPLVHRVERASLRTARERHRLLGLLRFTRLADGSYLARIAPTANVVPLLGGHFSKRLAGQRWLIVDELRRVGIFGEGRDWQLVEQVELPAELPPHTEEAEIVALWKRFYADISNPVRHNPGLRRQFMPKKYWRYLTELQPDAISP